MTKDEFIKYLVDVLIYPDHFEINKEGNQEFYKNNKWYFIYDRKSDYLCCSYGRVWSIFEEKYGLNYNEIEDLLKDMLKKYFNMETTKVI